MKPMIGVITQPLTESMVDDKRYAGRSSYIMAAYINWIESAGGRAVPLIYDKDWSDTEAKLAHLNGVLYCGGSADDDEQYMSYGKKVFDTVKSINDNGQFYPIWGTCLGFEDLGQFAADIPENVITEHTAEYVNLKLEFVSDPSTSKLFEPLGELAHTFETYGMTMNHHTWGISPSTFETDKGLGSMFKVTSVSYDEKGQQFVSSMEAYNYPFFGVQFHPEKPQNVFYPSANVDHSELSMEYNRYFADFFVDQARHNLNSYKTFTEEQSVIVENFPVVVMTNSNANIYAF